ncbi:MAG: hypothetical protein J6A21_10705 [Lentisphaeria bacterium]|nr:hypothetical protein [Lentisphaeria bacterium]
MWNSFGGFFLVFIAGALWIGVGVSVSKCSEKKLNYNIVQGLAYLGSALFCAILLAGKSLAYGTSGISWFGFVMCMLAGIANFFNYVLTGKAMQKGPNGLVWGIMQAGMIGSFLMGVTFFGEKPDFLRLTGLLLIVCGVLGMGLNKGGKNSSSPQDKSWVLLSLGAMVLVMVTHCCSTLPSFFPDLGKNDTVSRTLGMYLGGVTGFVLTTLPGMIRKRDFGRKGEWINAGILMVLNTSASLFFFYRGLDLLVKIGRAGLAYPLAIGVCVIGFSLYSLFVLKEKFARIALAGLGAVCAGIIMIAIR